MLSGTGEKVVTTSPYPRVALVFPPYGPPNLPSLGLAILSAGAKQKGFECRTFFWHYRYAQSMPIPGYTMQQKLKLYELFTYRDLYPWNEWIFTRYMLHDEMQSKDTEMLRRLAQLDEESAALTATGISGGIPLGQLILYLCNNAGNALAAMANELADYDIIGVGSTFFQNGPSLALLKWIKDRWPAKLTVLGGANCDGEMGRALMEAFGFLDYVFGGEVDHSFPQFLECVRDQKPVDEVPGLIYRNRQRRICEAPPARPVEDLDALPVPDFDDYVAERRKFGLHKPDQLVLPLESSRGCWWGAKSHCTFCGLNANGMAYRQKEYGRFTREVLAIAERYKARYLFMADNILSTKYFHDFVHWARAHSLGLDFFYEIKANLNRSQVMELADAGITFVQPGIESFSTKTLKLMRKGIRGIQNIAFLKYSRDYGLIVTYNILGGFPGEDPKEYETMAANIPKLRHLRPPNGVGNIEFHRFSPYHNQPESFGIKLRPSWHYSFIYPFDQETLARIAYIFEIKGRFDDDLTYLRTAGKIVAEWRKIFDSDVCTLTWEQQDNTIIIRDRRPGFLACDYELTGHAVAVFHTFDEPRALRAVARESAPVEELVQLAHHAGGNVARRSGSAARGSVAVIDTPSSRLAPPQDAAVSNRLAVRGIPVGFNGRRQIHFTEEDFIADPVACVQPMVDIGLLYEEDGWYLSLPVTHSFRKVQAGWTDIRV
jgi:ribosomal peptide maturation radical SAM protein 1